uniref:F-box domain-containing protein n=1 Tax=Ditylenchus dipsaci TaxID=166011 RepID=A0A915EDD8_9BILA
MLLRLPLEIKEKIFFQHLNYHEMSKLRRTSKEVQRIVEKRLNLTFYALQNEVDELFLVKFFELMPRQKYQRRKHPLYQHFNLTAMMNQILESMAFKLERPILEGKCCFYPGKVLDVMLPMLHWIKDQVPDHAKTKYLFKRHWYMEQKKQSLGHDYQIHRQPFSYDPPSGSSCELMEMKREDFPCLLSIGQQFVSVDYNWPHQLTSLNIFVNYLLKHMVNHGEIQQYPKCNMFEKEKDKDKCLIFFNLKEAKRGWSDKDQVEFLLKLIGAENLTGWLADAERVDFHKKWSTKPDEKCIHLTRWLNGMGMPRPLKLRMTTKWAGEEVVARFQSTEKALVEFFDARIVVQSLSVIRKIEKELITYKPSNGYPGCNIRKIWQAINKRLVL